MSYDNHSSVFREEIENRGRSNHHLEEGEIWYLLYILVLSAKEFSKIKSKVGDIRPDNILISESGQLKIVNLYSWPHQLSNYDKSLLQNEETYLSPEEMALLKEGAVQNSTDYLLSESFSIGMTLLHACLLSDCIGLYDFKPSPRFNSEALAARIAELRELQFFSEQMDANMTYSPNLKQIISNLLEIDPHKR